MIVSKKKKNQAGQALVEFVLLLVVVIMLSFSMKRIVMTRMSDIWKNMIETIAYPEKVSFR